MLQSCGPELYRDDNREEFQSTDVRRGVDDKIQERECKAFVEARGSATSRTSISGETKISKGPVGWLDNANTVVKGMKCLPPSQVVRHFHHDKLRFSVGRKTAQSVQEARKKNPASVDASSHKRKFTEQRLQFFDGK